MSATESQNNGPRRRLRPVIYQLFPRLFANTNANPTPGGRIETNGSGKMNDISDGILASISDLGVTHIWYTGVIEHAHDVDYTRYGIARHNPHIIKGRAGSPYAITDYYDIDPDLAADVPNRMTEFTDLLDRTHRAGMKAIIDFVPNHVAREYRSDSAPAGVTDLGANDDNDLFFSPSNNFYYITRQQFSPHDVNLGHGEDAYVEFPAKATGNDCFTAFPGRNDWYETVKLNYGVDPWNGNRCFAPIPDTWMKMVHILLFWASKGVDGFRCDMAHMVPLEFWRWAINIVKKQYPEIIFIAELYDVGLYRPYIEAGFDYLYDKVNLYDTLRGIVTDSVSAARLTSCWQTVEGIGDRLLNFLENHDEQRYASDFYAGDAKTVTPSLTAVTMMTNGAVMIYNGQELGERGMDSEGFSGLDGRTTIFDFWSMETVRRWLGPALKPSENRLTYDEKNLRGLYRTLLRQVNERDELRDGAFFDLMYVNYDSPGLNPHRHYAFVRSDSPDNMLVFLNFDSAAANASVKIPRHAFDVMGITEGETEATDILTGEKTKLTLAADGFVDVTAKPFSAVALSFKNPMSENRETGPSLE